MRTLESSTGGGIARAVRTQHRAIAVLDVHSGRDRYECLDRALKCDFGGRKLRSVARAEFLPEPAYYLHALAADCERKLGGLVLDRVQPVGVGAAILEQSIARAQRAFQRADARSMLRVNCQHEAIEKTPPLGRRPAEQAIHAGMQPDQAQMIRECCRRGNGLPVDTAFARD